MSTLSIGLSALQVSQRLLDLTGQNIANASTPNYHRQLADLGDRVVGSGQGTGVEIREIRRVVSQMLENAVTRNTSAESSLKTQLDALSQLEALLDPGEGSLNESLQRFFDEAVRLSTKPDDLTSRSQLLNAARQLADQFNLTHENIAQLRAGLVDQARQAVEDINQLAAQIARLNEQIRMSGAGNVNGLLDQRDQAVARLSEIIDVRVVPQDFGQINVLVGGTPVVLNATSARLQSTQDAENRMTVAVAGAPDSLDIREGRLAGLLTLISNTLPQVQEDLDGLATQFVAAVDQVHASGIGLNGPMARLASTRAVLSTNAPLALAQLGFPVQAGELTITVTNQATGARTLHKVLVDPATQSLAEVASAISTVPNLQAVVDPQAGSLTILARQGYAFDFSGRISTSPDSQSLSGSSVPSFTGQYTGSLNDRLDFRFAGSGTIGAGSLSLEVRNRAGTLITTLNVGQGYEASTPLPPVLGLRVKLAPGTVVNGDSFQLEVAAEPDTTGLLSALGLNSLFTGTRAGNLGVRAELLGHPELLALSATGEVGNGGVLAKLAALRDQLTMNGGQATFERYLAAVVGNLGTHTQDLSTRHTAVQNLGQQLEAQRQGVSGVDTNEELIRLVQYQRLYQISAHFISAVNEAVDDLFRLL